MYSIFYRQITQKVGNGLSLIALMLACMIIATVAFSKPEFAALTISMSILYLLALFKPELLVLSILASQLPLIYNVFHSNYIGSLNIGGIQRGSVVILVTIGLLQRINAKGTKIFKDIKLLVPMGLFLGILLVSTFYSPLGTSALNRWVRFTSPFFVYLFCMLFLNSKKQIFVIFNSIILLSMVIVVPGLLEIITGRRTLFGLEFPSNPNWLFMGTLRVGAGVHPNMLAGSIVEIIPIIIFLYILSRSVLKKTTLIAIFLLLFVVLFFTFTRIAWVSFLVSMFLLNLGVNKSKRITLLLLLLIFILSVVGIGGFAEKFIARFGQTASPLQHLTINEIMFHSFLQKPITGHGFYAGPIVTAKGLGLYGRWYEYGLYPHNDYMEILVDTGIIGLLSFLLLLFRTIVLHYSWWKMTSKHQYFRYLVFTSMASFTPMLIYGLTDAGIAICGSFAWFMVAVAEIQVRSMTIPKQTSSQNMTQYSVEFSRRKELSYDAS